MFPCINQLFILYRHIHRVLDAILSPSFASTLIQLPTASATTHPIIQCNPKFYPFFKDALGAIDGTHVGAFTSEAAHAAFRDRQGNISQNILAACTFDMRFCYILGGWEGSTSDSFLFEEARSTTFLVPEGAYFLADAGFPLCDILLVPYRGVRYHLREWGAADIQYVSNICYYLIGVDYSYRPKDYQELFNLRHAQLRNVIERIFGVAKRQFSVMAHGAEYDFQTQTKIFIAFATLFNFNQLYEGEVFEIPEPNVQGSNGVVGMENNIAPQYGVGQLRGAITPEEKVRSEKRRDDMAKAMWVDYQAELRRRGQQVD